MKMKTKIVAGFGIVLALLLLIGILAMMQFKTASSGFTTYRNLAKHTNLSSRLQENMLMTRMNVVNYLYMGDEKYYELYHEYLKLFNESLETSKSEMKNGERSKLVNEIDYAFKNYNKGFESIHDYMKERNNLVSKYLDVQGPLMEKMLTEILISAEVDGDMTASFYSSLAMKHLLLARLYALKFLNDNIDPHVKRVEEEFAKMDDNLSILDKELESATRREYLEKIISAKKIYVSNFSNLVEVINNRNKITYDDLYVLGPQIGIWSEDIEDSIRIEQTDLGSELEVSNNRANIIILVILIISTAAGFFISIATVNSVIKQLGADPAELEYIAENIAEGNLIADKDKDISNAIGVYNSMIQMREKLTEIVEISLTGTEQIATASEQLSSGNQDLSNRTEQQATALQETSAAIEEMNSSIRSNADNTTTANQLSTEALDKTVDGSEAVNSMITSMNEISDSSNRIADIIEVINNIAFQTNLLALNASIEAARAGEQGKGFAVVAVEVRKLAKRSDKAATEIAEIIKNSNIKVTEGVDIANKAGEMLLDINNSVKKVTTLVGEISASSQEQLSSVDQIDKTLSSLDENTQRNAALVEEAASSTEELSAQAQELNSSMSFFKVSKETKKVSKEKKVQLIKATPSKTTKIDKPKSNTETYEQFSSLADNDEFSEF